MSLWFKHAAGFGEHPKTLRLRKLAGSKADSAECGWWRIVEAAKRYGEWTFDGDEHLAHAAGRYASFIPLYREAGFLDGLTIHNADEYQGPQSGAERQRHFRDARNAGSVTGVTPRAEKSREEITEQKNRGVTALVSDDVDLDANDLFYQLTGWKPWGNEWSGDVIKAAINDYTDAAVQSAMLAEWNANHDRKGLVKGTLARLEKANDRAKEAARLERKPKPRIVVDDAERARVAAELGRPA